VGTPPDEDGSADLRHVIDAAREIGRRMTDYKVVVDKSTVPVGTGDRVQSAIMEELAARGLSMDFAVVSNPEFLKEGAAVQDFMRPDRVVIGADDERAVLLMRSLYAPFVRNHDRILLMDRRSAEFTKYAANAMLATRISFMNDLAQLADAVGVDIERVRQGIGSDPRIGYQFLYAGAGYGGSCFPKDVKALQRTARDHGRDLAVLDAVERVNERQKLVLPEKIESEFGTNLDGLRFALWGLAFKPGTDDMREAPSRVLVNALLDRGARIVAYDPVAMTEARQVFGDRAGISYADSAVAALDGADALVIITEWKEFRSPDFDAIAKRLKRPLVFDGRNLFEPRLMQQWGIDYRAIGRAAKASDPAA
jgi:UDPglucose 6-dehydrogenase